MPQFVLVSLYPVAVYDTTIMGGFICTLPTAWHCPASQKPGTVRRVSWAGRGLGPAMALHGSSGLLGAIVLSFTDSEARYDALQRSQDASASQSISCENCWAL